MKKWIITMALLTACNLTQAQERLSRAESLKYAFWISLDLKQLQSTPIPTDPDVKRPVALADGDYGAMVLPEAKLTTEVLAKVGKEVVPIGQLWLHKLVPLLDGLKIQESQLQMITVRVEDREAIVPCCALGMRRNGDGQLELLVFGKGKEPVIRARLKDINAAQENPLELTAERQEDGGLLTVKLLGKMEANFRVTDPELYN
jgi:hypothetical protein